MSKQTAAEIWRAYIDAETRRDAVAMQALLAPDIAIEIDGRPALESAAEDTSTMDALFDAYPDYHREIIEIIGEGSRAAARWRMIGHPRPELTDRLPVIDFKGVSVVVVANGRMTRAFVWSSAGVLQDVLATLESN